ncbi:MAG: succinate dehydrogenase assembly factor 4 [Pseudomonadota bacterium]
MPNAPSDVDVPAVVAAVPAGAPGSQARPATLSKETAESGGPQGPEPTRFGDWERNGRCIDF